MTLVYVVKVSKVLEDFEVEEKHISLFEATCPNVEVIQTSVTRLDADKKVSSILNIQRICVTSDKQM